MKAHSLRCTSTWCVKRTFCLTHILKPTRWSVSVPIDPVLCDHYRKADTKQSLVYRAARTHNKKAGK